MYRSQTSRVHTGSREHFRMHDLFRFVVFYWLRSMRCMMQFLSSTSKLNYTRLLVVWLRLVEEPG